MVTLSHAHDYVVLFAVAGLFGAIGGLAYELTLTRRRQTGALKFPSIDRWHYLELGFISSMFLGAVAAVAISYFFTPEVQVKTVVNGHAEIQTKWQIVKVIPLSLIVGSSGGAFLEAMRSRVLGQLNAQKVATTQAAAKAAVEQVARIAKTATAGPVDRPGGTAHQIASRASAPLAGLLRTDGPPLEEHLLAVRTAAQDVLSSHAATTADLIDASVDSAYATIDAAADAPS